MPPSNTEGYLLNCYNCFIIFYNFISKL